MKQWIAPEDTALHLSQLVLVNGFASNPDIPGTEKLCVTQARSKWLETPLPAFASAEVGASAGLAQPGTAFLVKGWGRSVVALGVLLAAYQRPELLEAPPSTDATPLIHTHPDPDRRCQKR